MAMSLRRNMCAVDRLFRMALGVALIYVGFIDTSLISSQLVNFLLGCFGLVNIVSALLAHCPLYALANLSTYREKLD